MRWWTSWRTAEPVVKSVTRENGVDGVGTALLGLHALGADVLAGLSRQTCVDPELVAESLAAVDVGPVAKAWSDAVMPGTDYGWLRVGPIKREADTAAIRVVTSLVSKGVAWPLALERAAAAYGLPAGDALEFAQQVSAPVVNPMVVADTADERLALHAVGVCKAESDVPVEFSKQDEWVEIKRGNRVYRQQVSRDDQGQFAAGGESQREPEPQVAAQEKRKQQLRDVAAKRRERQRMLRNAAARQRREQAEATKRIADQMAAGAKARRQQQASEALKQTTGQVERQVDTDQMSVSAAEKVVLDRWIKEKATQKVQAQAAAHVRAGFERMKLRGSQKIREAEHQGARDWVMAAIENWPILGDPGTHYRLKEIVRNDLEEQMNVFKPDEYSGTFRGVNTEFTPVLSVTPDGLAVLQTTLSDRDTKNHYVDVVSLLAAESARGGKELFRMRMLPVKAPLIEFPESRDDEIWLNLRITNAITTGDDHAVPAVVSDPNQQEFESDVQWRDYPEFEPSSLQRITLPRFEDVVDSQTGVLIDIDSWSNALNNDDVRDAFYKLTRTYSRANVRKMAEFLSLAWSAERAGFGTTSLGLGELMGVDSSMRDYLVQHDVIRVTGSSDQPSIEVVDDVNPMTFALTMMMMQLAPQQHAFKSQAMPIGRAKELADWAGVEVAGKVPQEAPSEGAEEQFPVSYSNRWSGPPWRE